jgi:RNA recognition motif-containing protein
MSVRLYVGNLPKELDGKELEHLLVTELGEAFAAKVVPDRKTGKCRGFGFITVESTELAEQVIEQFNGKSFQDKPLKIEIASSAPKEQGSETPSPSNTGGSARRSRSSTGGNNRSGGGRRQTSTAVSSSSSQEFQPDPRWANELEKLKAMLMAQTTNS